MANTSKSIITNALLIKHYLTDEMASYFYRKCAHEDKTIVLTKICELLKYLSLSHNTTGEIPMSQALDELWHLWILQTKEYHALMHILPSGKFIHHSSNDYIHADKKAVNEDERINRHISFLASYISNFGPLTTEILALWPMATQLMQFLKTNIEGLNQFLRNVATRGGKHANV